MKTVLTLYFDMWRRRGKRLLSDDEMHDVEMHIDFLWFIFWNIPVAIALSYIHEHIDQYFNTSFLQAYRTVTTNINYIIWFTYLMSAVWFMFNYLPKNYPELNINSRLN